jgi:hypothetical protein
LLPHIPGLEIDLRRLLGADLVLACDEATVYELKHEVRTAPVPLKGALRESCHDQRRF